MAGIDGRSAFDCLEGGGELGARMRAIDWSRTPLGPVGDWPQSLKTCIRIVLTSRQPMFVWWGEELVNLYNDAYKSIVGGKHPEALGQPARVVWREIWDQVGPRAATAMRDNVGTYDEALLLVMERNGYPEETYYTFSYSPVPNDQGGTGGILCANADDTQKIISERQLALLRELAARTADTRTTEEVFTRAASALATNDRDLPFALLYLVDGDGRGAELAASVGIDPGHAAAPASIALDDAGSWPLAQAVSGHEPLLVDDLAARFGEVPRGAWHRAPTRAAILPLSTSGQSGRAGFLVTALNPFRLFDEGYRGFLSLAAGQIAASLGSAHAWAEEKRRAEALAEIDRAKTAFFSNVSHEFRTPLTLMLGPVEDALADAVHPLPAPVRDRLALVHRNGQRLQKLVNTLLDFARIEARRTQASYEPTDLSTLTAELASAFQSATERAGLRYEVACERLPEPVFVDHDMWEKIVLNLISNAFKFTFEGGIRVALKAVSDHAELSVSDTGAGIPRHELPHLFERFHRVQGTRSRTHEGSGIGLALVHELVKQHGGALRVASELGHGATFTVAIPFGSAHLPAERIHAARASTSTGLGAAPFVSEALRWLPDEPRPDEHEAQPANAEHVAPSRLHGATGGARVLVADDNADMRDYLRRVLSARFRVDVVQNGEAALAAARRDPPDVIVTDVMMPVLDGFGLLRALRAEPRTRDIPVIMLSARSGDESRIEGLEAGASDYLVKPFSARELVARIDTQLAGAYVRKIEDRHRQHLTRLFMHAPVGIALLKGPEHRYELVNDIYRQLVWQRDVLGKPIREALPELVGQGIYELLDRVYTTGERFIADEMALLIANAAGALEERYFTFIYEPIPGDDGATDGVLVVAMDVHVQVAARRAAVEAGERFRRVFDSDMIGFLFCDVDGAVTQANDYVLRLLGATRDDVERGAVNWLRLTPPAYEAAAERAAASLRTLGTCAPFETALTRTDGVAVPVVVGSTMLPGSDRDAVTFVLDIRARKRVEQQLALLAETSRIIASSSDPFAGLQEVATRCSALLDEWCGVYVKEGDRLSLVASHHDDAALLPRIRATLTSVAIDPHVTRGLSHVVRTGKAELIADVEAAMHELVRGDEVRALADGVRPRSAMVVPLQAATATLGAITFATSDPARRFDARDLALAEEIGRRATMAVLNARLDRERAELLDRERAARAEAESANRAKDEFLAMLGHELRNPLAPIRTALQLMRLRGSTEAETERKVIERQVSHLVRLVDDLLDVSRITRGMVELKRQPVELAEVVGKAIEIASPLFEQRQHNLEIEVARGGLPIEVDPARMAQVVSNLLTNAAKYTEVGGAISIVAAREGDEIVLRVRDSGIGIEPDMLPRIFELFVQERQALDRSQGGLGLGLAIARTLVSMHGGTISAHSEGRGHGSEFILRLPAAQAARAGVTATRPIVRAPTHAIGRRVLIVDDNEDAAEMLGLALSQFGCDVRAAHDGPSALRVAEAFHPEVALLDIGLPVMDGYELARRLLAMPALASTRLVAVTGYGQSADRRRSVEAGFHAHLVKPVHVDEVAALVLAAGPSEVGLPGTGT